MSNNTPSTHAPKRNFAMKQHLLALAVLATFGLASTAQADVQSGLVGGNGAISVGNTEFGSPAHPADPNEPGIGQESLAGGKRVSFAGLQNLGDTDGTGAAGDWKRTHIDPSMGPPSPDPDHSGMGTFNFYQVASEAVYFGEWSQTGVGDDPTYAVYYAGQAGDVVNTLPTQTATYTVVGINQGNTLNGSLTANFGGDNTLTGTLFNSSLTIDIEAGIDSSDASFEGIAFGNTGDDVLYEGSTNGHFFGDAAAALAGIAAFDDISLNTAFGGAKD